MSEVTRPPAPVDSAERGPLAIVGVDIVDMDTEGVLHNQTVLAADGVITVIGPVGEVPTVGAQMVDGVGRYLIPGLADMHVHLWDFATAPMYLAWGVTTVRNMWGDPVHLAYQRRFDGGEVFGPRLVSTSPVLDGAGRDGTTVWKVGPCVEDPSRARALVQGYVRRGYTQIKVYDGLKPAVLSALGAAAAQAGVRMVGHCPNAMSFEEAIDAGITCFEHLHNIEHGRNGGGEDGDDLDYDSVRRLAGLMAERQIWNCPTQMVHQGPGRGDALSPRDAMATKVVRILHEYGAPLLAGTDVPYWNMVAGQSLHDELANLHRAGLRPFEVLRAATTEAARFLGENDWGTVAVGKRADLVLLNANPLVDVGATRDIEAVISRGRWVPRHELEAIREALSPRPDDESEKAMLGMNEPAARR